MLIGAFATGAVDAGLEAFVPATHIVVHPAIPAVDDWIASAGMPLALYALGKVFKKKMLTDMAKGGAVYTLPADEHARWAAAIRPVIEKWVSDMKAKGLAVEELMTAIRDASKAKGILFPY